MRCFRTATARRCDGLRTAACSPRRNVQRWRRQQWTCFTTGIDMDSSPKPPDTTLAPPPGLPREERLDTIAALIHAQDDAIALARRHIKVFDIDLSWGGWNAAARCEMLSAYLRRIPGARFDIIVHDTHWIESSGARLTTLLVPACSCDEDLSHGCGGARGDGPAAAGRRRALRAPVPLDRTGGTLSIGSPERAKPLVERFDEIWESGEPGVTGSVLGL